MTENTSFKNTITTEAPASWNTKYVTPDGFVCQITLRGENGKDLLEKANAALSWLRDNGFKPSENNFFRPRNNGSKPNPASTPNNNHNNHNNGSEINSQPNICPIHQVEMKRWEKDGRVWYSHKVDDGWCTGKNK